MSQIEKYLFSIMFSLLFLVQVRGEESIVFCDFESNDYGSWLAVGDAFGTEPACGTLPNQEEVSGYCGKRLVNTFRGGNEATGTLTSPAFVIKYPYISFLIGGGGFEGTCVNLIVEGRQVRTARGPNMTLGGHEKLDWYSWDVTNLLGKTATIQIVDQRTNLWGHICVDQIVFGTRSMGPDHAIREVELEKRFLLLPVKTGAPSSWMKIAVEGNIIYEFPIALAETESEQSFCASLDIHPWQGKRATLVWEGGKDHSKKLDRIVQSNAPYDTATIYHEKYRPQFHYTSRSGWLNDPNGLVFYEGEYHLFYQHDPFSVYPAIKIWGHAVSKDLFHWTELPGAIYPDRYGMIFSGSAVVDKCNTSGFDHGTGSPLVAFYTSYGPGMRYGELTTQALAYSHDKGRTWKKYEHNPIIPNMNKENRDPKVFWHEASSAWIMVLYMDNNDYSLFRSTNLKDWKQSGIIANPGCVECPDFFELPVDGNEKHKRWVFIGANGRYLIGSFDGWNFTRETESLWAVWGKNDYGAQSYDNTPGRRVQISWMPGIYYPNMPYCHQMTIPRELTLRSTKAGIRLCINPVCELDSLRATGMKKENINVNHHREVPLPNSDLLDLNLVFRIGSARRIELSIHGKKIVLLPHDGVFLVNDEKVPLIMENDTIELRIVLDRTSIEVFTQGGLSQIAQYKDASDLPNTAVLKILSDGSGTVMENFEAYPLKSVWF